MNNQDKQAKRLEQQIFYNLMKIVQDFPQYTMAQHLTHILREKGKSAPHYSWSDETLLKHFEDYRDELDQDLTNKNTSDLEFVI